MSMITLLKAEPLIDQGVKGVRSLLEKLLAAFGGPEFFFQPGERLTLLLDVTLPAAGSQGVNFDLRLAYALAAMARDKGVASITCAFRPEAGFDGSQVLSGSGYAGLADMEGVELVDLAAAASLERDCPLGLTADRLPIARPLLGADVLISLAKYRTAEGRLFGGALPSLAAATPAWATVEEECRGRLLADLYSMIAPDLFLLDCLPGSKGFQPHIAPCLLAATDGAAADAVLSGLAGLNMQEQPDLCLAAQYGMGVTEPAGIVIYGDQPTEVLASATKAAKEPLRKGSD